MRNQRSKSFFFLLKSRDFSKSRNAASSRHLFERLANSVISPKMSKINHSQKEKHHEMRVPNSSVFCVALLLLLATAQEARAYTDPGSGALIWQMLAAGFLGLVFYFRRIWSWVRTKMRGSAE
jgi:hypothetical protein